MTAVIIGIMTALIVDSSKNYISTEWLELPMVNQ